MVYELLNNMYYTYIYIHIFKVHGQKSGSRELDRFIESCRVCTLQESSSTRFGGMVIFNTLSRFIRGQLHRVSAKMIAEGSVAQLSWDYNRLSS